MTAVTSKKPAARHLPPPKSIGERLHRARFAIARRAVQLLVLALFAGTARFGWEICGRKILSGNLSASRFLDAIPMADPLAFLERLCAGIAPTATALTGFIITGAVYACLGSRTFCGWICPMNMVTDAAAWIRSRLGLPADAIRIPRAARYAVLAGTLIASAATGTAAFEAVSPQAFLWRDLIYGTGLSALSAALAVFALELGLMRDGWCGHLCPLGAFWAVCGKLEKPLVRISFSPEACTRCGDCVHACPERQIIRFKSLEVARRIPTGECLNCGRCIAVCPEGALHFEAGWSKKSVPCSHPIEHQETPS